MPLASMDGGTAKRITPIIEFQAPSGCQDFGHFLRVRLAIFLIRQRGDWSPMQHPLYEHFLSVQHRMQALKDRLTESSVAADQRKRIESDIELAELALMHYRKAYELEQKICFSSSSE